MPLGGIIGGLFGGGGGGGTSYAVTSTVQGGSTPVGLVSTVQGGQTPVGLVATLQGGQTPLQFDSTLGGGEHAVEVDVGLDDVNLDIGGTDTPLHSIGELRLPQPLALELDSHLDVEPVQVDVCLDVGLSKLPRARIDQPWHGRFGVRVLGVELIGYELSGKGSTIMDGLESGPHVELGPPGGHADEPHTGHGRRHRPALLTGRGLRVEVE